MANRTQAARLLFSLDAFLGILAIGAACLFGAAYNRHASLLTISVTIFLPLAALWLSLCYFAYRGLTSPNALLRFVFWLYVAINLLSFPIGTAIAGASIWLWRESRNQDIRQVST